MWSNEKNIYNYTIHWQQKISITIPYIVNPFPRSNRTVGLTLEGGEHDAARRQITRRNPAQRVRRGEQRNEAGNGVVRAARRVVAECGGVHRRGGEDGVVPIWLAKGR